MKGCIFSDQCCPTCGKKFVHNEKKNGLFCPDHPRQKATKFRIKFGSVCRRFNEYNDAIYFLSGLRFKTSEGSFDVRDYKKDKPLGFENLACKWLEKKKQTVKPETYRKYFRIIKRAVNEWGQTNIKKIGYAEIEDFIDSHNVSNKTKSGIKSCLHDFWQWVKKRKVLSLDQMPEFPEIKFKLGYRKTIAKDIQFAILDEIHRLYYDKNPRIWIAIKWLCTYISIRPGEMISLKEENVDADSGYFFVPDPKEGEFKIVPMTDSDIKLVKSLPEPINKTLPFFRHIKGRGHAKPGSRFGKDFLYKCWKKACKNLGIEKVDLYGGTRHSSVIALKQFRTPEEIKKATMHSTNKAFDRYFRLEAADIKNIYVDVDKCGTKPDSKLTPKNGTIHKLQKKATT